MASTDSSRISPTAHYTGFVWYRHGLSHPAFMTREGWLMHNALRPVTAAYQWVGGASLDAMLLARHAMIDDILTTAIEDGRVGQIVEVAGGLSPRGFRFAERFPDRGLVYVEGDLPGMVARKRQVLAAAGGAGDNHHVVELNALIDHGPQSIFEVGDRLLDRSVGTAVITEGLLGYFDTASVAGMWGRFTEFLSRFPTGLYLADTHLDCDARRVRGARLFRRMLAVIARGTVFIHFDDEADAEAAMHRAGFATGQVHDPRDFADQIPLDDVEPARLVHILEGHTEAR